MSTESWQQYNDNSATFRAHFEEHGAVAITGAAELAGRLGGGESLLDGHLSEVDDALNEIEIEMNTGNQVGGCSSVCQL